MTNLGKPASRNIIESTLLLLFFLALILALYDTIKVFFGILTFALIFSVSFSNVFEKLCSLLKGRRKISAVIYTIILIAIVAIPFIYLISALSYHVKDVVQGFEIIKAQGLPPLPQWIENLPLAGPQISTFWADLKNSPKETLMLYQPQITLVLHHIVMGGAGMLGVALQFVAGIIISSVFLVTRENMLRPVNQALAHLLGKKDGISLLETTSQAIKGVSIGVMGTAFIAAIISWIGLVIAGIPFALALSALIFFFVLIQIGPLIVWIPLIIWAVTQGHTGTTIFLIVYGAIIMIADMILKPVLIAKSGKLPFLVLFLGVIGGLAAWGFTGMFKGAIILAVFYKLFNSWLENKNARVINAGNSIADVNAEVT